MFLWLNVVSFVPQVYNRVIYMHICIYIYMHICVYGTRPSEKGVAATREAI